VVSTFNLRLFVNEAARTMTNIDRWLEGTLNVECRPFGALIAKCPLFPPLPRWATFWRPWRDSTIEQSPTGGRRYSCHAPVLKQTVLPFHGRSGCWD